MQFPLKPVCSKAGLVSLLAAALIFSNGCAQVEESMKPAELVEFDRSAKVKKVWSTGVGKGHDTIYSVFKVAVVGDTVYAADDKGLISAINVETGKTLWKNTLKKTRLGGAIGASASVLVVASIAGEVIALNAEDGSELWRAELSSESVVPPATDGRIVVVPTIDGRVFAFSAENGEKLWSYDHPKPILSYRSQAAPVIFAGQVFVAFDNGQLMSFAADDGQLRWAARVSQPEGNTELERTVDLDSSPVVDGPFVYAAGLHGRLAAVNRGTGRVMWAQDMSTYHDIAVGSGKVFVTDEESHIHAFDASTGQPLWENDQLHRRDVKAPSIFNNYVSVIDDDGFMHLLSMEDGSFVYRFKPGGDGFDTPSFNLDEQILVYSNNGKLTAYEVEDIELEEQADEKAE